MCKDMYISWEWYAQYNTEQLELLKKISENRLSQTESKTRQELIKNITTEKSEDEDEYILWLA